MLPVYLLFFSVPDFLSLLQPIFEAEEVYYEKIMALRQNHGYAPKIPGQGRGEGTGGREGNKAQVIFLLQ